MDVPVGWLIAARVLQAMGAALLTPASLSLVLEAFPISKRSFAVSVLLVHLSQKRIFNFAAPDAGMTFVALLPTSMVRSIRLP